MSRLATDAGLHKAIRDLVIALNRAENAQARGGSGLGELHDAVRDASQNVEECLINVGWTPPNRTIRLPQPDVSDTPTAVITDTGVSLEY